MPIPVWTGHQESEWKIQCRLVSARQKKKKISALAPDFRFNLCASSLLTHKVSPPLVPKFLHVLLGVHSFSLKKTVEGVHLERTVPFLMKTRSRNASMCFLSRDLQLWLKFQDIIKVCLYSIKIIRPPKSQTKNNCVWML